ncbi:MAG: hypothetical protein LAT67_03780 [Balneolales bacterium]|nr:hypothetical protein [Balneolales bacterium]
MLQPWLVILVSAVYFLLLFTIAYLVDNKKLGLDRFLKLPFVYALSLGVYCTAWTFYGSVGRAASSGIGFLPIYIGPTLMALLWVVILKRMISISRNQRITTISDFVASRYGKSSRLAKLVSVVCVVGIIPYIGLQLKAVSGSFHVLVSTETAMAEHGGLFSDTAFYTTIAMILFGILFGARHLDSSKRHEGLVAAVAFESVVKLVAFLVAGISIVWFIFNGPIDLFSQAAEKGITDGLFTFGEATITYSEWFWLTLISMFAILLLPRQFQVAVIENISVRHVDTAVWLFPLYLLLINLFVIPIALAGLILFPAGTVDADTFVITIPLMHDMPAVAMLVFIGGISAATSMVIVAVVAISTMLSNDLFVPALLKWKSPKSQNLPDESIQSQLLFIKRLSVVLVLLASYFFISFINQEYSLVSIGLISFAAVAQFAPAIFGGMFFKKVSETGAFAGIISGSLIWFYTLVWPTFELSGIFATTALDYGPAGIWWLNPHALFGLNSLDPVSHSVFWSLSINSFIFAFISIIRKPKIPEIAQAELFTSIDIETGNSGQGLTMDYRTAAKDELLQILTRFLGEQKTQKALSDFNLGHDSTLQKDSNEANEAFIQYAESVLGGIIGAASAREIVSSAVSERPIHLENVMVLLDETRQALEYSRALESKTAELNKTTDRLTVANEKLKELDLLKDEFMYTVTHELKTPLTSIRAFSELIKDHPEMDPEKKNHFLGIITSETDRLSRLITQILELQKFEQGFTSKNKQALYIFDFIDKTLQAAHGLIHEKNNFELQLDVDRNTKILADNDFLEQAVLNLLSNATKFANKENPRILLHLCIDQNMVCIAIHDNGEGLAEEERELVFKKFSRGKFAVESGVSGSGIGLAVVKAIAEDHKGLVTAGDSHLGGACFKMHLPILKDIS